MAVLGIRCSNKDFSYAILAGSQLSPTEVDVGRIAYPKGFTKPRSLKWLLQEITDLIKKHAIRVIVIKAFEGRTRGKAHEDRVEHQAAVIIAGANCGLNAIFKKPKSTIAKDLGKKGRARYLAHLDTSVLPSYDSSIEKIQEAMLSAWSGLN